MPGVVYSFPTRVRCPECKSIETERYSCAGRIQYRRCREKKCGHRFHVVGTPA